MARPAREDADIDALVWPAADAEFQRTGKKPQNIPVAALVRAQGNPISTAHVMRSLNRWQKRQPPRVTVPSEPLPEELLQMLAGWLERDRQTNRTELDARIKELEETNEGLAREALEDEAELRALQSQLDTQSAERATLTGQLGEVNAARDKLVQDLEHERKTVKDLDTKLITADLRVKELDTLRADHDRLRSDFQKERDARTQADKELAGEKATRAALAKQVADLEAREKTAVSEARELRQQLAERTDQLQQVDAQRAEAAGQAGTAQGALTQLTKELEHQRADLVRAQGEKADAVRAAGVAEGARARAEGRIQELDAALDQCRREHERLVRENSTLVEQVRVLSPPATATAPSRPSK